LVRGSTTTVYLEGVWEEIAGGVTQIYYMFNGRVVAVRDSGTSAVTYLHNDHLGSVSVATDGSQAVVSQQEFYPWGTHRGSGDITQTTLDFTGQRLDGSKLLYYHARYYDPGLGRFVTADSIVPGADALAIGSGGTGGGPANPQSLNRYSYVDNNPLNHTDPSGHIRPIDIGGGGGAGCAGCGGGGAAVLATASVSGLQVAMETALLVGVAAASAAADHADAPAAPDADRVGNDAMGDYHLPGDVPDSHTLVRGGIPELPERGTTFSGSHGPTLEDAASGVPHGTIRSTTAGDIRGGVVVWMCCLRQLTKAGP